MITQQVKLNLIPGQVFPRVNASQYDNGTRTLQMNLYNGDQVFNIASGMSAVVQGTKPDNTGFQYSATITEGSNIATLDITQQMTAVSGEVVCELVISSGDDRIATVNFILFVEAAALKDDTIISETELPLIEEAAELAQRIDGIAADVEADADRAEAAADNAELWASRNPYIGSNGNWFVFNSTTEEYVDTQIAATGPQGPQGDDGPTGPQGPTGATGNGIVSITKTGTSGLVDTYTITFTDGSTTTFTVTNGQDGQGAGDMTKAVYDSTNAVADAGGIAAYVAAHSGAGTLAGLTDVTLSSLAAGDTLVYNATTQKWENSTVIETLTNKVTDISDEIADMNNVLGAKNILINTGNTLSVNGITFTVNKDKSITVDGTATADAVFVVSDWRKADNTRNRVPIGLYELSCENMPENNDFQCVVDTADATGAYVRRIGYIATNQLTTINIDYSDYVQFYVFLYVASGTTVNNVTVYPMLRPASIQDDTYEPYSMTNREMTPYVQAISNPNLLDNPWFTVNQRGFTSESGINKYTVDRWYTILSANVTVNADKSITITGTGDYGSCICQKLPSELTDGLLGREVTFSALLSDGTIYKSTDTLPLVTPGTDTQYCGLDGVIPNSFASGFYWSQNLNSFVAQIGQTTGHNCIIKAIKLELGSVSTLAMDTAPNYATELLKCQRYFISFNPLSGTLGNGGATGIKFDNLGAVALNIPLPVAMRTNPTLSFSDYGRVVYPDGTDFLPSSINVDGVYNNNLRVYTPVEASAGYKIAVWQDYKFTASADL